MNRGYPAQALLCALGAAALTGCVGVTRMEPLAGTTAVAAASAEEAAELATGAAQSAQSSANAATQAAQWADNTLSEVRQERAKLRQERAELAQAQAAERARLTASEDIHLVRYVAGDARNWPTRHNQAEQIDPNDGFADLYTRFLVISGDEALGASSDGAIPTAAQSFRSYRAERPGWLARLFTEEERSIVAVVKISVLNPQLEMTVPLYSVSYNSGGKSGEAWATSVTASHVRSPLFRITGNSRFAINVKTSTSDATQSSGFSTAISALTSAVSLVAPEAGVLTTLSTQATKDRALALDSAISDLLSYSISEEIEFGRMMNTWKPDAVIWLAGCAPFVRADAERRGMAAGTRRRVNEKCANDRDLDRQQNHYIGSWRLVLSCPQFSVFSSRSICKADNMLEDISSPARRAQIQGAIAERVPDSLVLEEPLGENATVRSLIRGKDFFIAFVDVDKPSPEQYGQFCASTMDTLRQAGLTGLDAALGLRATLRLMPEFVADRGNAALTAHCITLLRDYGVTL
jgi:hypothetical protein